MNYQTIIRGRINHQIDVLLSAMSLDDDSTATFVRTQGRSDFERWFFNSLEAFLNSKAWNGFLTDDIVDHLHFFSPWTISGLSEDFPSNAVLQRIFKSSWWAWRDLDSTENYKLWSTQGAFCRKFSRRYPRIHGQRFFLLESEEGKLVGLGPNTLEIGDSVWASSGSEWPYIFRPREEQKEAQASPEVEEFLKYEFVGEAYVHGIMHGELFRYNPPRWQQTVLR